MARVNPLINSFTAGELTPRLDSRVDTTKYKTGAKTLRNFIVMPHGGVRKRGGSKFVAPVKASATGVPLLTDFQYNTEQAYMLEIGYADGLGYIRIFANGGILTSDEVTVEHVTKANPAVVSSTAHGLVNGQWVYISGMSGGMTQLNNRHFKVANKTDDTFELEGVNSSGYDIFSVGGTAALIVEVATPYAEGEEENLSFAQSADVLYIAHRNHKIMKLSRLSATSWTLSESSVVRGPFRSINRDDQKAIYPALIYSTATVTGATQARPVVVTTSGPHGLTTGATVTFSSVGGMTQLNGERFTAVVLSDTTVALHNSRMIPVDGTAYGAYTSGGTLGHTHSLFGTYAPGSKLALTCDRDVFDALHVGALWRFWEPGKGTGVSRPLADESIAQGGQYTQDGKVYGITNLIGGAIWQPSWQYPNHESGHVRVTDDTEANYFDSIYLHDSSCVVEILSVSNAREAVARIVHNHMPRSCILAGTWFWEEGAWSDYQGYPSIITLNEQRLWAAGSRRDPQVLWGSTAGDAENFQDGADDDRAVIYRVQSDKVETPVWISPGKILMMGTASGEFSITASGQRDEAITPSNVRIVKQTHWGSAPGKPIRIGSAVLFLQRNGKPTNYAQKVREFGYDFNSDSFVAPDMTILSEHLGNARFVDAAYQQDPDPVIWVARLDGSLVGLTYEKEQQVLAWHKHDLGGTASVRRIRSLPGEISDDVWMIVEREIDGETVLCHEVLTQDDINTTAKADSRYLDCHLTYDGDPTTTISGLWHLEGETVNILADGAVISARTVVNGKITLPVAASKVHVGYSYMSILETLDIEAGTQAGTAKGIKKRVSEATISFYRTLGGRCGNDAQMDDIPWRSSSDPMDSSPPLFTGFKNVDFPGDWEQEAIVRVEHDLPLPCNVRSLTVPMNATG